MGAHDTGQQAGGGLTPAAARHRWWRRRIGLSAPSETLPATGATIRISAYKQILFLPLRLADGAGNPAKAVTRQIRLLEAQDGGVWSRVTDPLAAVRLRPQDSPAFDRFSYQEFVYFHSFIQKVLYPRGGEQDGRTTIFERKGPIRLGLDLQDDKKRSYTYTLRIERLWLYIFDIGVAVAMVELHEAAPGAWQTLTSLDAVLRVQNAIRRVYPPFFGVDKLAGTGQPRDASREVLEYPLCVRLDGPGLENRAYPTDPAAFEAMVRDKDRTPFARHWGDLLAPLRIAGTLGDTAPDAPAGAPEWEQTMDERLPSMTFLMSPDAGKMQHHHWVRLGCMDEPSDFLPYSAAFLAETFDKSAFYDRHWHANSDDPARSWGTRFVLSGFGFVCCATDNAFPEKLITHHFSRIYAGMGLLLHLQHAALLSLSSALSDVAEKGGGDLEEHQQRMKALQQRFNTFVQRYWFTNVSNQMQARELYDQWKRELGLDALFREVNEQMKDAAAFLDSRLQMRQSDAALRLNQMAALGLPVALTSGLLGMNVVISDKFFPDWLFASRSFHAVLACLAFSGAFALSRRLYRALLPGESTSTERRMLCWLNALSLGFGAGALIALGLLATEAPPAAKAPSDLSGLVLVPAGDIAPVLQKEPLPLHRLVPAK